MPHRDFLKKGEQVWLSRDPMYVSSCPASKEARFKVWSTPTLLSWPGRVEGYMAKGGMAPFSTAGEWGGCMQNGGFGSEPPVRAMSWELDAQELHS